MTNICFIPAKGNSRRLRCKNKQKVGNKSLIDLAIESAIKSECYNRIIVSSNDKDILECAGKSGVEPFIRPEKLCHDKVRAIDVIKYHLDRIDEEFESVTMLMPTNPFRTSNHVLEAYKLFKKSGSSTLISVVEFDFNPCMAMSIDNGKLIPFDINKFRWDRKESFPEYYHFNGAIFIAEYHYFMTHATFLDESTTPYIMDRISSIDIDTKDDLLLANALYEVVYDRYH